MKIFNSTTDIDKIYNGSTEVKRVYKLDSDGAHKFGGYIPWQRTPPLFTFGGVMISPQVVTYNSTITPKFQLYPNFDWTYVGVSGVYGESSDSYLFSFIEAGKYFDADGSSFSTSRGNIDSANKLSGWGYSDWRIPTKADWENILSTSRTGATVNGTSGRQYAFIYISDSSSFDIVPDYGYWGLLLAPDGVSVYGMPSLTWNSSTINTINIASVYSYTDAGFVFLLGLGYSYSSGITGFGYFGEYMSATQYNSSNYYYLYFNARASTPYYTISNSYNSKTNNRSAIRLVRGGVRETIPIRVNLTRASNVDGVVEIMITDVSDQTNGWFRHIAGDSGSTQTIDGSMYSCEEVEIELSSGVARRATITDQYADNSMTIILGQTENPIINVRQWSSGGALRLNITVMN